LNAVTDILDLTGTRCLVTGATGVLGGAIAARLRARGADLVLTGRSAAALESLVAELRNAAGGALETVTCDLAAPGAVEALIAALDGRLDVLVNNAAIPGPIGPVAGSDFAAWDETIRFNLLLPVEICRAAIGLLAAASGRRRAKIINMSGGGATSPRPNFSAYSVAKTGVVRFTEILAQEVRAQGIDVNAVAPGALPSVMTRNILAAGAALCAPHELAIAEKAQGEAGAAAMARATELIAWLAAPASDGVTGRLIAAQWDPWPNFPALRAALDASDIYTLRRILPVDRGQDWS
jgi:NAD(P)-dependent dehydrogenase (short-subunit alcohol dehydrogenase family)